MPRLSCWFIRAALLHLGGGVVLGGLVLSGKGLPVHLGWAWLVLPAHIQLLIGGWLIQLALGVAYWILPRLDTGGRGRTAWAWCCFGALNTGVTGTAFLLLMRPLVTWPWIDGLLVPAAALQLLALIAFAVHAWPRIKPIAAASAHAR